MSNPFVTLSPAAIRVLANCPLHYHFLQQAPPPQAALDRLVREAIWELHAAGGPARLALADCVQPLAAYPPARQMVERYYHRLARDWPQVIAGGESLELKISMTPVSLLIQGELDRLDKTADGGILGIIFRTEDRPPPTAAELLNDLGITAYHALVAAGYPDKRPVRIQEWWLRADERVTVELSQAEYRHNLGRLRGPVQALARGDVAARPGLHCDWCPFKDDGCPVYAHETPSPNDEDNLDPLPPSGKITPRTWIFKDGYTQNE
jgi:hypothetical protein